MTDETATGERHRWRFVYHEEGDGLWHLIRQEDGVDEGTIDGTDPVEYIERLEARHAKARRWRKLARRYHEAQTWRLVQEIDEDYDAALADEGPQ